MSKDRFAEFDGGSGGFSVDYVGTVTRVRFGINDVYGSHTLRAFITTRFDKPQERNDGSVQTERTEEYNIGPSKDWEATDGGKAFRHNSGDPDRWINGQADYARLLKRLSELGARDALSARGDPAESRMWEGIRWHVVTQAVPAQRRVDGKWQDSTKDLNLPSEYLGLEGEATEPSEKVTQALDRLSPETREKLTRIAETTDSAGTFTSKALGLVPTLEDEEERDTLVNALGSEGFFDAFSPEPF